MKRKQALLRRQSVISGLAGLPRATKGLRALAAGLGYSASHLRNLFVRQKGESLGQALRRQRLDRAASLLLQGKTNVSWLAIEAGFDSVSGFSRAFRQRFGLSPRKFFQSAPRQSRLRLLAGLAAGFARHAARQSFRK